MKSGLKSSAHQFFPFLGYVVFSMIAAVILLQVGTLVARSLYRAIHPYQLADALRKNPAYFKYSWAEDLHKEQLLRVRVQSKTYLPFRVWGLEEWHGKYMNNDATKVGVVRRTINPRSPGNETQTKTTIWIVGGSTVYGTHVPDWATLPSYISRELNSTRGTTEITNFGVEGYVTNQDMLVLLEQLKAGRHPDIVIFYGGFNDSYAGAIDPGVPGAHLAFTSIKARVEGSIAGRLDFLRDSSALWLARKTMNLLHRKEAASFKVQSREKTQAIIDNFEANLEAARALGKTYGFRVFGFWQPAVVYGHKPLVPFERLMVSLSLSDPESRVQGIVPIYQEAERRAATSRNFVFLGGVFDRVREPIYLDWVHLSPVGNEIAAHAIAEYIRGCSRIGTTSTVSFAGDHPDRVRHGARDCGGNRAHSVAPDSGRQGSLKPCRT